MKPSVYELSIMGFVKLKLYGRVPGNRMKNETVLLLVIRGRVLLCPFLLRFCLINNPKAFAASEYLLSTTNLRCAGLVRPTPLCSTCVVCGNH